MRPTPNQATIIPPNRSSRRSKSVAPTRSTRTRSRRAPMKTASISSSTKLIASELAPRPACNRAIAATDSSAESSADRPDNISPPPDYDWRMSLRVYNTLSKQKELFEPVRSGQVGIYLCGPTVYKPPHMGHMVGPVIFDAIKRYLQFKGYSVTWV